jgi:beta-glucosidase
MGFNNDFFWGAATATVQIEGATSEEYGKGLSVWDVFCKEKGKVYSGHTPDIACDHYHRIEEDVKLMSELGINTYRLSISWTRILPNGIGEINQKGIDFYNKLIDTLLKYNIIPFVTLFHWDYPYELEKMGGWLNNESPKWFENYARIVAKEFGDRVKHFVTINEPQCFIGIGYKAGFHAPGKKHSDRDIVLMGHNVLIAHGLAVSALRENAPNCKVGYAPTGSGAIPLTNSAEDIEAARKAYFDIELDNWTWSVSWWSDPVLLGRYPEETQVFKELSQYLPKDYKKDMNIISTPIDFYGQNLYNGALYKSNGKEGYEWVSNKIGAPRTAINWPVTPKVFYWAPKFLYERYKLPIIITENGISCTDWVSLDGKVHDPNRIDFTHRYLIELKNATDDGVDILGYMHWTLMDNFEWSEGYKERFGLIYIDYETLERIPKDSYYWYKEVIKTNGNNL